MTAGERIKRLCEESKISQKRLAESTGCTDASMSRWLNGERKISADVLVRIAKYFDVSADYILGLSDKRNYNGCVDCDEFMEYCEAASNVAEKLMMKSLKLDEPNNPDAIGRGCIAYKHFEHEFCTWKYTMPHVIHSVADGTWKNDFEHTERNE